jgi:DNA-binding CsgD family transcriptional regulator/tetratricopeptide (TPR) repeat protein
VELLERDGALAALAEARTAAARGEGRVVFVTGEPGIGKTALITRFARELEPGARVLLGTCDDLSIPRPLGPIQDLAGSVSAPLEEALSAGAAPHEIQGLLIAELELTPQPTLLVLEDVHWADDATLDSVTVLGRRIGTLPALLVLTFREGEAPPGHPLRAALGAIRAHDSVFLDLSPLSRAAVATLAGTHADGVYAATGGNPFYVTELLDTPSAADLPPSVANAVLGRASRLDDAARHLVELVSVVPSRVSTAVLDAVLPDWSAAAVEPERRQLLEVDPRYVHFRHELARNAIRASVPIAARRRLHGEILEALLAAGADPADIVHHAEAAGAEEVVAEYALVAARRAAALDSNREAYSHYRRASDFFARLPAPERAAALEQLATSAYDVARLADAFPAIERAIAVFAELGDDEAVGRCTRVLSRFHWYAGDGDSARRKAVEAIVILEPLGESIELARAYSGLSQLAMLAADFEQALEWGEQALELAIRLGDETTRTHALINIGSARIDLDHRETATLVEAHRIADALGDRHEATRALGNLGYATMSWVRPAEALRYSEQALSYAREHEVHTLASYAATMIAWLSLRAGEWDEAERVTRGELERQSTVPQLLAKTVLAELAVRRGDPDAHERLTDLAGQADRAGELQRITPVLELATEWALTSGEPMPTEWFEAVVEEIAPRTKRTGWGAMRIAAWAAVAGLEVAYDEPMSVPHAAMLRRDWPGAAAAFGEVGWTYDRALMLSLLEDEASLAESIEIARTLGAAPLTRRVARRMRELGLSVPPGPRQATRANPAGLTARQLEVLSLLAGGLTNAEIAERLVVSPRTAEHHVAAVLTKLGAATRRDAARRASELGLSA